MSSVERAALNEVAEFSWSPPPDLSISQWADNFREIPPEASAEAGKWRTDRAPYQRDIMDAISDTSVDKVIVMSSAQVGKTEILLNTLGYFIDQEPSPMLLIQPTLEMAQEFSKNRLAPMIRDTPCLAGKVSDAKAKNSGNTILQKNFAGGHLVMAGANSPVKLAGMPMRVLLCDEVDRYPVSAGSEGDPLSLADERSANFWNRRIVYVSTPTNLGSSRIAQEFAKSDRREWCVPCPECGELQPFEWERIIFKNLPEPVMQCRKCGKNFNERAWKSGLSRGVWIAGAPEVSKIRGFHLNAFASPWSSWPRLIKKYLDAYDNGEEQLKVWTNTTLGLPYESKSGAVEADALETHRQVYDAELPEGVLYLTCGVDVQDDRLELEVVGWGLGRESWGICYRVIWGDPSQSDIWNELDDFLAREFKFADGLAWRIERTFIDSGGHFTNAVYRFCRGKTRRGIFAIKGVGTEGYPITGNVSRGNNFKIPLVPVGVSTVKGDIFANLRSAEVGRGFCHWPLDLKNNNRGYDEIYFKGLVSERMVEKRSRGRTIITWEVRGKHVRNEPLDARVYAYAAMDSLRPRFYERSRTLARLRGEDVAQKSVEPTKNPAERTGEILKRMRRVGARIFLGGKRW